MSAVRCDNATGAVGLRLARVGCVVPWYPAAVTYYAATHPTLANHVARAQASGLDGGSLDFPLYRSTDASFTALNRSLACGDAPSIPGRSCDEYPLASTYNGLATGGTRRTFAGCDINAPLNVSGPGGASACMINASENHSQGGIMSNFYYDYRILNWDPYRVLTG
jgi:hypothetical protein